MLPSTLLRSDLTDAHVERFWLKIDKNGPIAPGMDTPCWLWTASRNGSGYGTFGVVRGSRLAHRVSWLLEFGALPEGDLRVLHHCDVPACVRPDHLWSGTQADNARDREEKNRGNHEIASRGSNNGSAKLNESTVAELLSLYCAGTSIQALAQRFDVTDVTVGGILHGRLWRHIPRPPELVPPHPGKLTRAQAEEVRRRYAAGEVQTALAEAFGVRQGTISKIVRGATHR